MAGAGRTNTSKRCATPGPGSKSRAPCATTGVTTLPARRIACASSPSSGRAASKKTPKAATRGPAGDSAAAPGAGVRSASSARA